MHPMSEHADVNQYVGRVSRYAHSTVHADAGRRLRTCRERMSLSSRHPAGADISRYTVCCDGSPLAARAQPSLGLGLRRPPLPSAFRLVTL
jgi:hypothetical protein